MIKLWDILKEMIFPIECAGCGEEGKWLCDYCFSKIEFQKTQICPICAQELKIGYSCKCTLNFNVDVYLTFVDLKKNISVANLIYKLKYDFIENIARDLAKISNKFFERNYERTILKHIFAQDVIFVPMPLYKRRLLWRGFNQIDLIALEMLKQIKEAKCVASFLNCFKVASFLNCFKYDKDILARIKNTRFQGKTKMPAKERIDNVKDAFIVKDQGSIKDKTIVLFDDIITTGSTMEECARILKEAGATRVVAMAIGKG